MGTEGGRKEGLEEGNRKERRGEGGGRRRNKGGLGGPSGKRGSDWRKDERLGGLGERDWMAQKWLGEGEEGGIGEGKSLGYSNIKWKCMRERDRKREIKSVCVFFSMCSLHTLQ